MLSKIKGRRKIETTGETNSGTPSKRNIFAWLQRRATRKMLADFSSLLEEDAGFPFSMHVLTYVEKRMCIVDTFTTEEEKEQVLAKNVVILSSASLWFYKLSKISNVW